MRKIIDHTDHGSRPDGRVATRWFLFLVFFHLLPAPWFMVVAGLAPALERQIMDIEDRYRVEYQKAVNRLKRGDGSREGRKQFRSKVEQLRRHYADQR